MSDDSDSDVVIIEDNTDPGPSKASQQLETHPLKKLLQNRISNSHQNLVLTNGQFVSILQKEFDIDITTMHELEADIYMAVIKRFLKDWPRWDEFDQAIEWLLKKEHADKSEKRILERNYKHLKYYLNVHIDATKPVAQEAVSKFKETMKENIEKADTSDVVLEVHCTRKQLNELIYSHPNSETDSIFHLSAVEPGTISVNSLPMESFLNWWGVRVSIQLKCIVLTWETSSNMRHVLVNSNNGPRNLNRVLNENIQIKEQRRSTENVEKTKIFTLFNTILMHYPYRDKMHPYVLTLFDMIQKDFELVDGDIKVPAIYRKHLNKYPYYRKLCTNTEKSPAGSGKVYDLYLEETLAPMHMIDIRKIGTWDMKEESGSRAQNSWLTIECVECKTKFKGIDLHTHVIKHFYEFHANEPDWICTNCAKTFPVITLTKNRWHHICDKM